MINLRSLMVLLSLIPTGALAQELSAEDRTCINAAIDKLPRLEGLMVEGSRIVMSNPEQRTRNKLNPYTATVEIDVSLSGAKSTHSFFCHGGSITRRAQPVEVLWAIGVSAGH